MKLLQWLFRKKQEPIEIVTYPGFDIPLHELSAFAYMHNVFIISLKNGRVIQHICPDPELFYKWLVEHNIRNLTRESLNG